MGFIMVISFNTVEREGYIFPKPGSFKVEEDSTQPYSFEIGVDTYIIETYFKMDGDELEGIGVFQGWNNFPLYTFDEEAYKAGKDPFVPFDPYASELTCFRAYARRKTINRTLAREVTAQTELKHLRKAVKALIALVNPDDPDIAEFLSLSDYIDGRISEYPKETVYQEMDLEKENGRRT